MSIFEFKDYREYLRAAIRALPHQGRGELSKLARHLRVNNTLLSQVLAGGRDFTLEQGFETAKYLGLRPLESDYFSLLIQHSRAATQDYRNHIRLKLEELKKESQRVVKRVAHDRKLSEEERSVFYSSWIYSAVHLFTSLHEAGVTHHDIAKQFHLSPARTSEITQFLNDCGLIEEKNSKWKISTMSTFVEQGSVHLLHHHRNWRLRAIDLSQELSDADLMFTAQVSLSEDDFHELREKLLVVIQEISDRVRDSKAEKLATFHLDWLGIR